MYPGGTHRNFESYCEHLPLLTDTEKAIICDPQTSGGLLIAVSNEAENEVIALLKQHGIQANGIGSLTHAEQSSLVELT